MWYANGLRALACLLVASTSVVAAQTVFHNDGNVVYVGAGAVVTVEGAVNNHNNGTLSNGGTFSFTEDWSSDTPISDDVSSLPGTFVFAGDFQDVRGSGTVAFPSVRLTDSTVRVDQVATDVSFTGELYLADGEWATGARTATVLNPDPGAIDRRDGFVSSDTIGGYLVRLMDREADYLFPTGSNGLALRTTARYRPVIIRPNPVGADPVDVDYAVRLGNIDPSLDFTDAGPGWDRTSREPVLTQVNDAFYHMIDRPRGDEPADLNLYYDSDDGRFSTVAQVEDDRVWRDQDGTVEINATPPLHTETLDRVATVLGHDDYTFPVFTEAGSDSDDDGVPDRYDLDADNDGIANVDEYDGRDPYGDHDGDEVFNYLDADFPGCGGIGPTGVCASFDFDLDGFANHLDLDADGDGIADILEAGGVDDDYDAQIEYPLPAVASSMIDVDEDGFADARDHLDGRRAPPGVAEVTDGTPWPQPDRDGDGLADYRDIDADGDGIVDIIESQTTFAYTFPAGFDGDRDGLDNAFDFTENGFYSIIPANTDGADDPDYLDYNSDNEGGSDLAEGYDLNGDGILDAGFEALGTDADGDGLDDRYDATVLSADPTNNPTNAFSFPQQFPNFQVPATDEPDFREVVCVDQACRELRTTRNQRP